METGNILGCAYVNALTRLIGIDLMPRRRTSSRTSAASVLQQASLTQAVASDRLLLCEIGFRRKEQNSTGASCSFPRPGLQEALRRSLHAAPWNLSPIARQPTAWDYGPMTALATNDARDDRQRWSAWDRSSPADRPAG